MPRRGIDQSDVVVSPGPRCLSFFPFFSHGDYVTAASVRDITLSDLSLGRNESDVELSSL